MYSLKDNIFRYFGYYDGSIDSNKDSNGKGTLERFNESMGWEYDEQVEPLISGLADNVVSAMTCYYKFLPTREYEFGNIGLFISPIEAVRRKVLKYIMRYWQIKGTHLFLKSVLGLIGLDCLITEYIGSYSFDSSVTFDDDDRRFDMKCQVCSSYRIDIVRINGSLAPLTQAEINGIIAIEKINRPYDCQLKSIWFNSTQIV